MLFIWVIFVCDPVLFLGKGVATVKDNLPTRRAPLPVRFINTFGKVLHHVGQTGLLLAHCQIRSEDNYLGVKKKSLRLEVILFNPKSGCQNLLLNFVLWIETFCVF